MAGKYMYVLAVLACLNIQKCCAEGTTVGPHVPVRSVPFMASVQASTAGDTQHVCGGSIVHHRFVLTAASCFYTSTGETLNLTKVVVGMDNLNDGGISYDIESLFPHPRFLLQTNNYDVGLVKLKKSITFGNNVRKIQLADGHTTVTVGDYVEVADWRHEEATNRTTLRRATVQVVETKRCRNSPLFGRIITSMMICAGNEGDQDQCHDIGGPLFVDNKQVAIASRQRGCGESAGLYTNIQPSRQWLLNTMF